VLTGFSAYNNKLIANLVADGLHFCRSHDFGDIFEPLNCQQCAKVFRNPASTEILNSSSLEEMMSCFSKKLAIAVLNLPPDCIA